MMSDKLDWTKSLGDAMLAQQADLMDAIQRLREKARGNNKLVSNKQQTVTVKQQESKQVIAIEQTDPNTVYVPYYEPATVYGAWPYADYPPYYFGYPSYIGAGVVAAGIAFGTARAIGRWGNYWGGGCNWGTATSMSTTAPPTFGSTMRRTAVASVTTMPTFSSALAITAFAQAPAIGWTSAARAASRCSIPERTDRAAAIAPATSAIAQVTAQATVVIVQVIEAVTARAIVPIKAATERKQQIVAATAPRKAAEATAPLRRTERGEAGEAASTCPRAGQPVRLLRVAGRASPVPAVGAAVSAGAVVAVAAAAVEGDVLTSP